MDSARILTGIIKVAVVVVQVFEGVEILGVDPGNTTGWARFVGEELKEVGEFKYDDRREWIAKQTPNIWVVENYRIRPPSKGNGQFVHAWDKGTALRIIGACDLRAYQTDSEFYLQEPTEKVMGYTLMGKEYKKGKPGMHIFDATAHVKVWLAKQERLAKNR